MTYANAYGRFGVLDNLCAYSMAATAAGLPAPLAATNEAQIFGTSNGIPPTSGISLINNAAPGGPKEDRASTPAQNLEGALPAPALARDRQGRRHRRAVDRCAAAAGRAHRRWHRGHPRHWRGCGAVPAVFVTGATTASCRWNFTSRAYFGLNHVVEGSRSSLRYYEVTNAHHLDSFNQFAGYNAMYIPLHRYFIQAMDLMYAHLKQGTPLPPSQVVHTTPRGAGAPPITASATSLPIAASPGPSAQITFTAGQVRIPD